MDPPRSNNILASNKHYVSKKRLICSDFGYAPCVYYLQQLLKGLLAANKFESCMLSICPIDGSTRSNVCYAMLPLFLCASLVYVYTVTVCRSNRRLISPKEPFIYGNWPFRQRQIMHCLACFTYTTFIYCVCTFINSFWGRQAI